MLLPPVDAPIAVERDYIPLMVQSPFKRKEEIEVRISRKMMEHLEKYGPKRKFYDSQSLPDVLEHPAVIFEGLSRTPFEKGFCYSCVPPCRWLDDQVKMPLPLWKVFLAYVIRLGDNYFVLDWNWRPADRSKPGYPRNWERDYTREIWPTSSLST
jgi:hypothetical protein